MKKEDPDRGFLGPRRVGCSKFCLVRSLLLGSMLVSISSWKAEPYSWWAGPLVQRFCGALPRARNVVLLKALWSHAFPHTHDDVYIYICIYIFSTYIISVCVYIYIHICVHI